LDVATALSKSGPARPGDTVWLRGGTYPGCVTSDVAGTAASPVVVRAYPGERATIDGRGCTADAVLVARGPNVWFWGIEVTNSDPERHATDLDHIADLRPDGVEALAAGTKFINMVVHDNGNGFGFWKPATDSEIYGSLTYNNGWWAADRGHGHGIYTQNETGTKTIADVISFHNFSTGMKGYGVDSTARGDLVDGVISADNGAPAAESPDDPVRAWDLFVGTKSIPADDITVRDSMLYSPPGTVGGGMALGWASPGNGLATATGNYIAGGADTVTLLNWTHSTVSGNTIYATGSPAEATPMLVRIQSGGTTPAGTYAWDDNTYYDATNGGAAGRPFYYDGAKEADNGWQLQFAAWQAAGGFDGHSSYQGGAPTGQQIFVRGNRYEPGRANVAVYNWTGAGTAAVDISAAGLANGQAFEIRDAENFYGAPVAQGVYSGAAVDVPLTGLSAVPPIGDPRTVPAHTAPRLGIYVVLPVP
jgi:hypothetical protein